MRSARFAQTVTTCEVGQAFVLVVERPLFGLSYDRSAGRRKLWCALSAIAVAPIGWLAGIRVVARAVANKVSMALGLSRAPRGGIGLAMRAARVVSAHRQCSTFGGQRFRGRASSARGVSRAAKFGVERQGATRSKLGGSGADWDCAAPGQETVARPSGTGEGGEPGNCRFRPVGASFASLALPE